MTEKYSLEFEMRFEGSSFAVKLFAGDCEMIMLPDPVPAEPVLAGENGSRWYDGSTLCLTIKGLSHPMLKDTPYVGEETKNPQMRAATDVAAGIFHDQVTSHRGKTPYPGELTPLENSTIGAKSARYDAWLDKEQMEELFNRVKTGLEASRPEIEDALRRGKDIPLEDPNGRVQGRVKAALFSLHMEGMLPDFAPPTKPSSWRR